MITENSDCLSFNVKFKRTPENIIVFEGFKDFAKYNTKDGYLLAIELLLERNEMLREYVRKNE